jgi:hypothetical protein
MSSFKSKAQLLKAHLSE